jgi:starch phosphorylase
MDVETERREIDFHWNTRNPWLVLKRTAPAALQLLAEDTASVAAVQDSIRERARAAKTIPWFERAHPAAALRVAYFSMEYGISDVLPLYAGGFGVLAGDYLKAASDLGVPITAIGLLYVQGYFRQTIAADGSQLEY